MTEVESLEIFIRNQLAVQSELPKDRVRNELSIYGTVLDEQDPEDEDIFDGIDSSVPLILFNVSPMSSEANVSETEEDGKTYIYCKFNTHVIIYGDSAATTAQLLIARLRTQAVRSAFMQNELCIEEVTEAEQIEEFKNAVMWIRDDFDLNFSCKIEVKIISPDQEFLDYSTISTVTTSSGEVIEIYSSEEDENNENN